METLKYYHKYIKTHLFYLISKKNLIVLIILNSVCLVYTFYLSNIYKNKILLDAYRNEYYNTFINSYFLFIKIIFICLILFLNISYFGKEYKEYSQYFIRNKRTKIDFYVTKYLSFILVTIIEVLFFLSLYFIFNSITPYGKIEPLYLASFINIAFLGIFYFLFSSLFMIVFKTYLSSLFSLVFFWISFAFSEYQSEIGLFTKIILFLFPFPRGNYNVFEYGIPHVLMYIVMLVFFNILVLINKDEL